MTPAQPRQPRDGYWIVAADRLAREEMEQADDEYDIALTQRYLDKMPFDDVEVED